MCRPILATARARQRESKKNGPSSGGGQAEAALGSCRGAERHDSEVGSQSAAANKFRVKAARAPCHPLPPEPSRVSGQPLAVSLPKRSAPAHGSPAQLAQDGAGLFQLPVA